MRQRENKIDIKWNANFAYAIGLIATDGYLSNDGRHISLTTKDLEIATLFKKCLKIDNKISRKGRGYSKEKKYYLVQFGDINFFEYLVSIGITNKKSKTIKKVDVPDKFYIDFLRGCLDGDGSISVFDHPESKKKQLKLRFYSASKNFLIWIKENNKKIYDIESGHIYTDKIKIVSALSYAKTDGGKILKLMYYSRNIPFLKRKKRVFDRILGEW